MSAPARPRWTILFVGTFPWEANLRRDVHRLFGALAARGHRLAYVEPTVPPPRRRPASGRAARDDPHVVLFTPPAVPGRRLRVVDTVDRGVERRHLRRAWTQLGLPPPDVVVVHPAARRFYLDLFPGALRVWRNLDLVPREDLEAMAAAADLVLTSSPRYARSGDLPAGRTRLLPNCCDDHAPLAARRSAVADPAAVGTMGSFGLTTDFDLLREVVDLSSRCRFLLQGMFFDRRVEDLRRPWVELVERTDSDPGAVEAFLTSVRVGLCPYRRDEWTLHGSATRMLAFLRSGLPVVTTDYSPDALEPFRDLPGVFVADDPGVFAAAIPRALEAGGDPAVVQGLVRAAEPYLAANVAARFEEHVAEAVGRTGAQARRAGPPGAGSGA